MTAPRPAYLVRLRRLVHEHARELAIAQHARVGHHARGEDDVRLIDDLPLDLEVQLLVQLLVRPLVSVSS